MRNTGTKHWYHIPGTWYEYFVYVSYLKIFDGWFRPSRGLPPTSHNKARQRWQAGVPVPCGSRHARLPSLLDLRNTSVHSRYFATMLPCIWQKCGGITDGSGNAHTRHPPETTSYILRLHGARQRTLGRRGLCLVSHTKKDTMYDHASVLVVYSDDPTGHVGRVTYVHELFRERSWKVRKYVAP